MLIAIEGTDGCGKATQSKLLNDYLNSLGKNSKLVSFPNYESASSAPVKMYLNGDLGDISCLDAYQSNALYAVDRLCTMQFYKEHIAKGGSIVFDRYVESSMIYQASLTKNEEERERLLSYIKNFEFNVLKLPKPDVVVFLNVPIEFSKKLADAREQLKSGTDKDIYESNVNHLITAYNVGLSLVKKYGWLQIDCVEDNKMLNVEEIHKKIKKALNI